MDQTSVYRCSSTPYESQLPMQTNDCYTSRSLANRDYISTFGEEEEEEEAQTNRDFDGETTPYLIRKSYLKRHWNESEGLGLFVANSC
ncbi:hypothetical protein HanRHA438_Chr01g0031181 [Helianthus annuus]|nr:hypothetical protein HanRHA438_Chr01g0031181 [Helianthus annuus]